MPDVGGSTVVVTGGNSGIGWQVAKELAVHGARVVLAVRNLASGEQAAARIRSAGGKSVEVGKLNLASMDSVRAFGAAFDGPLDLLVNNAGVMAPPKRRHTRDGFELQFGTNHLGHYVLTGLLLPALLRAPTPRVLTVSSVAHRSGGEDVLTANANSHYDAQRAYANSKLANLLFALELQREAAAHGVQLSSVAAHPGVAATGLVSDREGMGAGPFLRVAAPLAVRLFTQSAASAARAPLYAAVCALPGSYTGPQRLGETRGPIGPARMSACAQDEKIAHKLWQLSEELTGFIYPWPSGS